MSAKDTLKFNVRETVGIYTRRGFDIAIQTLQELLQQALEGKVSANAQGICSEWDDILRSCRTRGSEKIHSYAIVPILAMRWKKGVSPGQYTSYPVPQNHSYYRWEGPNLAMRIDLMRYVIKRLRDLRRRTPA